jgi:hypothetical protein
VFHLYCFITDTGKTITQLKEYNQNNIVEFLTLKKSSIEEVSFVMAFFDRRNKNNISHPGEKLMENWVVNKVEYDKYLQQVINIIKRKLA